METDLIKQKQHFKQDQHLVLRKNDSAQINVSFESSGESILRIKNQHQKLERVVVIGAGYVGFPLACALASSKKYNVTVYDIDTSKIDKIRNKISPVEDERAKEDIKKFKITGTTDESVLSEADYIIVCVPTPVNDDKTPDLTPVIKATESIARNLRLGQTIILESTVNPGVCEETVLPILEKTGLRGGINFELAHCPERINPGDKNWNVYNISRNIGALTLEGANRIAEFYSSFLNAEVNVVSSIKAAEATKIIENTFRDVNIALINEFAQFCDKIGIDVLEVIKGASNKPFAFMPHFPGCGVGGHCIPVDPYYLIQKAAELGFDHKLVRTAREVNSSMPKYTISKLINGIQMTGKSLKDVKIGILGLAYKSDSEDLRESPALEIRDELLKLGADVLYYDPYIKEDSNADLDTLLDECYGIIVATGHTAFKQIKDWKNVKVLVDGRNCLSREDFELSEIYYYGIGRGE